MSYINAISTSVPEYCFSQEELSDFYIRSTDDILSQRKIKVVAGKSGINARYSVISDYGSSVEDFEFFNKSRDLLPEPSLSQRMDIYQKEALALSLKAVEGLSEYDIDLSKVTHLITVTCTGLFAPGLDIELIRALKLSPSIQRSSVNFMGCNAAILAIKNADMICRSTPHAQVLVVCTELCTIHFQKRFNDDYILSNLLFGDGAAAIVIGSESQTSFGHSVKIEQFNSMLLHDGYPDMAWQLSETGFVMNLSSYVPTLIKNNIRKMILNAGINPDDIKHWAIHPGGKKILDDFALAFDLDKCSLSSSFKILKDYGNMSSSTILFVLKELFKSIKPEFRNDTILAAAFGPGLSIETMSLRYV